MLLDYLDIDKQRDEPLYSQLYRVLRSAFAAGHIPAGERLPSIRRLAEDLHISRTTVEAAYQQLCVEGYMESKPQRGYFAARLPAPSAPQQHAEALSPQRRERALPFCFSTSAIDSRAFRIDLWQRYIRDVLAQQDVIASYGDPQGEPQLREALTEYCHSVRGVAASAQQIIVGAGTQPLLSMLGGMLREQYGVIGMESPGFLQAEQVFTDCGLSIHLLSGDKDGVTPSSFKKARIRVLYLNPSDRLGAGTPIPMPRRMELLKWAEQTGGLIIEDDHNGELRYHARPIPALQGIGDGSRVVYIGTFSKVLLPSVRMAYMVLPPHLAEQYAGRRTAYNQTASKIEQLALARYIREGQLERQLRRLRKIYAAKGDALLRCLTEELGSRVTIALQETALRLLVTVHNGCSSRRLAELAAEQGVQVAPFDEPGGEGRVLLGFAGISAERIPAAVRRLKTAWFEMPTS